MFNCTYAVTAVIILLFLLFVVVQIRVAAERETAARLRDAVADKDAAIAEVILSMCIYASY